MAGGDDDGGDDDDAASVDEALVGCWQPVAGGDLNQGRQWVYAVGAGTSCCGTSLSLLRPVCALPFMYLA